MRGMRDAVDVVNTLNGFAPVGACRVQRPDQSPAGREGIGLPVGSRPNSTRVDSASAETGRRGAAVVARRFKKHYFRAVPGLNPSNMRRRLDLDLTRAMVGSGGFTACRARRGGALLVPVPEHAAAVATRKRWQIRHVVFPHGEPGQANAPVQRRAARRTVRCNDC
jgi:hypothetical protein